MPGSLFSTLNSVLEQLCPTVGASRNASLDDILTDKGLDHLEWIHSAETRAAEALFIERLLKRARELLPR